MTRDDLSDRLEDLEKRCFRSGEQRIVDDEDQQRLRGLFEDAQETLPQEKRDRLDELTAEMSQEGVFTDELTEWPSQNRDLTPVAKEWLSIVVGDAAEAELEQDGL